MKNETSNYGWLKYAALAAGGAVGGYVIWSNRSRIRSFLQSQDISLAAIPAVAHSVTDAVQVGAAKLTGLVEREAKIIKNAAAPVIKEANH